MNVGSNDGDNNGNNIKGKRLVSDEEATKSEEQRSNFMCKLVIDRLYDLETYALTLKQ